MTTVLYCKFFVLWSVLVRKVDYFLHRIALLAWLLQFFLDTEAIGKVHCTLLLLHVVHVNMSMMSFCSVCFCVLFLSFLKWRGFKCYIRRHNLHVVIPQNYFELLYSVAHVIICSFACIKVGM